jgi:hypothetical protein
MDSVGGNIQSVLYSWCCQSSRQIWSCRCLFYLQFGVTSSKIVYILAPDDYFFTGAAAQSIRRVEMPTFLLAVRH